MNLTDYFNRFSIEGLSLNELKSILSHSSGAFQSTAGTLIVRKSSAFTLKSIDCVREYWTKDKDGKKIPVPGGSHSLRCHLVRQALDINESNFQVDCATCHRECLRQFDDGVEISRIYSNKNKKRR